MEESGAGFVRKLSYSLSRSCPRILLERLQNRDNGIFKRFAFRIQVWIVKAAPTCY
jgi:hypothetical protein